MSWGEQAKGRLQEIPLGLCFSDAIWSQGSEGGHLPNLPLDVGDGSEGVLLAYLSLSGHVRANRHCGPCRCGLLRTLEGMELEAGHGGALRAASALPSAGHCTLAAKGLGWQISDRSESHSLLPTFV